jgi:hypothetical protein
MLGLLRYRHIHYALTRGMPEMVQDKMAIEKLNMIFLPIFLFTADDG